MCCFLFDTRHIVIISVSRFFQIPLMNDVRASVIVRVVFKFVDVRDQGVVKLVADVVAHRIHRSERLVEPNTVILDVEFVEVVVSSINTLNRSTDIFDLDTQR